MPDLSFFFIMKSIRTFIWTVGLNFILHGFSHPALAQSPISSGQELTGSIGLAMEIDTFRFTANAGDQIELAIGEQSDPSGNFDPWIRLFSPGNTLLADDVDSVAGDISITASNTGTYTVQVSDYDNPNIGDDIGTYRIGLFVFPGAFVVTDDGGSMTNGANHDGRIDVGDLDAWSFEADAGDRIEVATGELTDDTALFNPWIRLYAPDGSLLAQEFDALASDISTNAPVSGTYTVLVADYSNPDIGGNTGTYRLHLFVLPDPFTVADDGGPMTNGGNHATIPFLAMTITTR